MNENNYIQTIGENSTLQDSIIENMYLKAFASISDAENTSKEKYITKTMLIKSSNDMSTQEKLTSLDKNYEYRNYERWQNLLYFTIISFSVLGVAVASPIAMKNVRKLFTTTGPTYGLDDWFLSSPACIGILILTAIASLMLAIIYKSKQEI